MERERYDDCRNGQTFGSPPAEPGVYLIKLRNIALSAVTTSVLAWGTATQAATYHFGTLLSGSGPAFADIATLEITNNGDGTWTFDLATKDLFAIFGGTPFVGVMAIDGALPFDPPPPPVIPAVISSVSGDVAVVDISSGGGPTGIFDYRYGFGGGAADRLTSLESVQWTVSDYSGIGLPSDGQIALHIQGLDTRDGSAWYVSPVPEPETYAMLLAGLGLIGFSLRRQKR